MLIELPNGDWIDPSAVLGLRIDIAQAGRTRVVIDTRTPGISYSIEFDGIKEAGE